jgi:hypothetical protein
MFRSLAPFAIAAVTVSKSPDAPISRVEQVPSQQDDDYSFDRSVRDTRSDE